MGALTQAYVTVLPDTRSFGRELEGGLRRVNTSKAGKESGRRFGGSFASGMKGILGGAALLGGFAAATGFLKDANAEARESVKVGKITAQIIKSTGGSAKITANQVSALATSISNATGKDDELVQSGANLLLTFKQVRNETGKNNNIFDRATRAAVDLSATGFGSVQSSSKMLGKALQDPVRGLTALGRAGVTFTEQQKEQIRRMVESGNVLGAQKIIMKEVESQVGGVAAASADASEKYAVSANNFKELVGGALKPVGDAFFNVMSQKVIPALSTAVVFLSKKIPAAVAVFRNAFRTGKTEDEGTWLESIALAARKVMPALQQVGGFIKTNVLPGLTALGRYVATTLLPAWLAWYKFLWTQLTPILKQVGGFILTSVIPAFRVVARFIAREVVPAFLSIVETVKDLIRVVAPIIGQLVGVILGKFKEMRPEIKSIWTSVKEIIVGVMFVIKEVVQAVTTIIRLIWTKHGKEIKAIVGSAFGAMLKTVAGVMKAIAGVIKLFVALIKGDWRGAWNAIKQIFAGVWQAIKAILINVFRQIDILFGGHLAKNKRVWTTFWAGIKTSTSAAINNVRTTISTVLGRIVSAFSTAKANIGRVWSGVKGVVSAPIEWVKNNVYNRPLVPVWNRVAGLVNGPKLSAYATGGVHGVRPGYTPGRDTHTIAVGGGEAIMRPEWTRAAGADYVHKANRAARTGGVSGASDFIAQNGLPGFASGGIVGWIKNTIGSAGAAIGGLAEKMKGWALGGLRDAAAKVLSPLRGVIRSQLSGSGVKNTVGGLANKALDLILDKIKSSDAAASSALGGGGPIGAGGYARAEAWARTQIGKPYSFAGVGPRAYDCSGFVGAIHNVILGRSPHSRRYSSGTFLGGPHSRAGLTRDKVSPFRIGVIPTGQNGGRIGHMAATLNGRNFESAGGVGTRSGGSARGWNAGLFKYHYGLARGGIAGDYAFDTLDRRGQRFDPGARALIDMLYDSHALARGAVVRGGRGGVLAHIGEGSRDELVTPLPRQGGRAMAVGGVTFSGPIHVHGVTDAAEMVRSLQQYAQRNGGVRLKVLTP